MFYRQTTDGTRHDVPLEDLFGGPFPVPCWILGGGPSLARLPVDEIARSPVPKFSINLAGTGLLRPDFWTSYDSTSRFHRSVYLDPSIFKFVHRCRAMDLVPETTYKVCEAPATVFFDRDRQRGFDNFLDRSATGIADWQDSLIQAIDVAYRLGFRQLILAGCEMFIPPSEALLRAAAEKGVSYRSRELLRDFLRRCEKAGFRKPDLEALSTAQQYHFEEQKPLAAAVQTDFHYFRVAQYLRLSRRSLSASGLELVSVTPQSRLNDDFPFVETGQVLTRLHETIGDPRREQTAGRYTDRQDRRLADLGPMRDFRPHFWAEQKPPDHKAGDKRQPRPADDSRTFRERNVTPTPAHPRTGAAGEARSSSIPPHQRLQHALDGLPEIPIDLNEP